MFTRWQKPFIRLLIAVLLMVAIIPIDSFDSRAETAESSLLVNGSFETVSAPSGGWTRYAANGWIPYVFGGFSGTPVVTVSDTVYRAGGKSLQISAEQTSKVTAFQDMTSVKPGEMYRFSGWFRTDQVVSTAGGAYARINFMSSSDTITGSEISFGKLTGTTGWTYAEGIFQIPANTVRMRLENILNIGTGTAWFDDLRIVPWKPATGIELDREVVSIAVGELAFLNALVSPADATDPKVVWSTSNPAVATVKEGEVFGVGQGTAYITAKTSNGGFSATAVVTVGTSYVPVTGVVIRSKNTVLLPGDSFPADAEVLPAGASDKRLMWSSSNPAVATAAGGIVTAVAPGTARITATSVSSGYSASFDVTVNQNVLLNGSFEMVSAPSGGWTGRAANGWIPYVFGSFSGTPVVTVSDTVYRAGGKSLQISAEQTSKVTAFQDMTSMKPGEIYKFSGWFRTDQVVSTAGGAYARINFMSSSDTLTGSEISFGKLTGTTDWTYAEGIFQIPANTVRMRLENILNTGKGKAWFDDLRIVPWKPVTGVTLAPAPNPLHVGQSVPLTASVIPADANDQRLTWSSSDPAVAIVSGGIATAIGEGVAAVTVSSVEGGYRETKALIVGRMTGITLTDMSVITAIATPITQRISGISENSQVLTYRKVTDPEHGTALVQPDGTWTYSPKPQFAGTDRFLVSAADGTGGYAAAEITVTVSLPAFTLEPYKQIHPRLHLDGQRIDALKPVIVPGGTHAELWNAFKSRVDKQISVAPPVYYVDPSVEELWQRDVSFTMINAAYAYLLTGDSKYFNAAKAWALAACNYPTWGRPPAQNTDLSGGHMLYSVALVYDWLYNDLDDSTRKKLRETLLSRGNDMYKAATRPDSWHWNRQYLQNHNWIALTGLLAAGLAVYDEAPEVEAWLKAGQGLLLRTTGLLGPDGASQEGYGYAQYGLEALLKYLDLSRKFLGADKFSTEWVKNAAYYQIYLSLPVNSWWNQDNHINFADEDRFNFNGPDYLLRVLASEYKNGYAQWMARVSAQSGVSNPISEWMGILWYDPEVEEIPLSQLPTMRHFEDMGIVMDRSDWSGNESVIAFKSGPYIGHKALHENDSLDDWGGGHAHPDANHFVWYGNGDWLIRDDGYNYKYTSNQNTLLIDGKGQLGEGKLWFAAAEPQSVKAEPRILKAVSTSEYSHMIGDAAQAYPSASTLKTYKRHLLYVKPDILIVVDDIETEQPKQLELRFYPEKQQAYSLADGSFWIPGLKTNFNVMPLTSSPGTSVSAEKVPVYDYYNTPADKLALRFQTSGQTKWRNAVAFTFSDGQHVPANVKFTENGNIWRFEVGDKAVSLDLSDDSVTTGPAAKPSGADATLSQIFVNGNPLQEFSPNTHSYSIPKTWKREIAPVAGIPSDRNAKVTVVTSGQPERELRLHVTSADGTAEVDYVIKLENTSLLSYRSVTSDSSSAFPITHLYDDSLNTYWAVNGENFSKYDLGSVHMVNQVSIAWYLGHQRKYSFDIDVSEDGSTWSNVWSGYSSGTTENEEFYSFPERAARFVRLRGHGNTASAFTSIREVNVYDCLCAAAPSTTAAVSPEQPDGQNSWYMQPVTVRLSAQENRSGVSKTEYSLDGGVNWVVYTAPIAFDRSGDYTLGYRSADLLGNTEVMKTVSFAVDVSAPIISSSFLEGQTYNDAEDLTLQFEVTDDMSGVDDAMMAGTLDGRSLERGETVALYELPLGSHTLTLTAADKAGNSVTKTVTFQTAASIASLKALVARFAESGWIDNKGIENSLQQKLEHGSIGSFINQIEALAGKHISGDAADYLLRDARMLSSSK
ncbi:Ig-like domain-containing protein [Paenibacillus sp. MBLB4367]|uniref:Ig-like domain-containing protein n=1 Tax=Paenibacillus sp. MBLB4367 TaxID=3384767 RepID=UPI0039081117